MTRRASHGIPLLVGLACALTSAGALAQEVGDQGSGAPPPAPASPGGSATGSGTTGGGSSQTTINVVTPPSQTTTSTTYSPIGLPAPGTDSSGYLPSSSRGSTDTSRSADGFDLAPGGSDGAAIHGSAEGAGVLGKKSSNVPALHQVKKGDTLWDLCGGYYQNPWLWPKIWSYNPQIQNPHWIYPGDQVRLRVDVPVEQRDSIVLGGGRGGGDRGGGFISRRPMVPRDTIFLRSAGYIDDPKKDVWGELAGAQEEQMLLTQGNIVYLLMRPGVDLRLGQLLTVFRSVRTPEKVPGARKPPGEIIAFKGSVKIDQWNPKTRIARGRLIESLDVIERGDKIGPVGRRFEVVAPRKNEVDLEARVLTSLYPHEIMGSQQVVFIDRGSKDGLTPGNRMFVMRRGDEWRHSLKTTTTLARTKVRTDVPEHVQSEVTPIRGRDEDFPDEVVGELRILRTDEYSSVAMVSSASREIEPGTRAVAKKGY